jgi:hypothetical protein
MAKRLHRSRAAVYRRALKRKIVRGLLEFKAGADQFDRAAKDQVTDYALDLKNFHAGSYERLIVPKPAPT